MIVDSTDGCRVALHDLGGSGPDLVICHATGFHGRAYEPLARQLGSAFKVWAIDMRGHGVATAPDDGDFSWDGMAADLSACIDALGGKPIRAFGHSMGGAAILLTELSRPGIVVSAYLYEPIIFPNEHPGAGGENALSGPARKRRSVFPSKEAALWRYASRPPLGVLRSDALAAYVEHGFVPLEDGTVQLACLPENEARTFEAEAKMTTDRLHGIATPVAVAAGGVAGSPNPADFAPLVAENLDHGVLVDFPHLGHFGPLQDPDLVGADARRFLVEASPAT